VADQLMVAEGATLGEIAKHIHSCELRRKLKSLSTNDETNYAMLERPSASPRKGIEILAAPAVGPKGSTKICDGELTIGGAQINVTAYRLG
jgi:hypothetical protein